MQLFVCQNTFHHIPVVRSERLDMTIRRRNIQRLYHCHGSQKKKQKQRKRETSDSSSESELESDLSLSEEKVTVTLTMWNPLLMKSRVNQCHPPNPK